MPREPLQSQNAGRANCPNCNAEAKVVVEREKPRAHYWQMYVVCDKCKSKTWVGFVSEFEKNAIDRRRALMKKWEKANTPAERGQVMNQVRAIASEEELWNRSL